MNDLPQLQRAFDLSPYDVLRREMETDVITIGTVHEYFVKTRVPHMVATRVYLTFPLMVGEVMPFASAVLTEDEVHRRYQDGTAICEFIDRTIAQEHPADKRFLLRYMEQACLRYGLNQMTSIGFNHDVIYVRGKLTENYTNFDNTLYVPPLTGQWAIVQRRSAR